MRISSPLVLLGALLAGCGNDAGLIADPKDAAPTVAVTAPVDATTLADRDPVTIVATIEDADDDEASLSVWWVSSLDGPLTGTTSREGSTWTFSLSAPLTPGAHAIVVTAIDEHGAAGRASTSVVVYDPDLDGDGHDGSAHGGDDCDDGDATVYPGATDDCDGRDQDCDDDIDEDAVFEAWYADADADGAGDPDDAVDACVEQAGRVLTADDCDDADAVRQACTSCAEIVVRGWSTGDGAYTIDPSGGTPFEAWCDMSTYGGGWTLVATNGWDDTWDPVAIVDDSDFGDLSLDTSHKSRAFTEVLFRDLHFENGVQSIGYEAVGDGTTSWQRHQKEITAPNCGDPASDPAYTPSFGGLEGDHLCDELLYVHPVDREGIACNLAIWDQNGWGPTWSTWNNTGCPLDEPYGATFFSDIYGLNPWGSAMPLRMWVR